MKKMLFVPFLIIFFLLFSSLSILTSIASSQYDPALDWKVLESPHFSIHFPQNKNNPFLTHHYPCNEQVAKQVAGIA